MTFRKRISFLCLGLLLPASSALAQGDPMQEIKEIAESVNQQLQEIDRLLLESGKKNQDRQRPKELLEQARERSATVEDGIDKLIEKLTEMKNQGSPSSSSSGSQGEQQPQDGQQQSGQQRPGQGQQQRRENQTPDFVQQPQQGQQQGQQQQGQNQPGQQDQPQDGGKPQGGQEAKTAGQNQPGSPQQDATGPGQPGTGQGGWGELQPYLNFLRNRGASPKVPDKYRKYYEAYLKQKAREGK